MAKLTPKPKMQFFNNAGGFLAGGKVYTYEAGTSTPLVTYTDQTEAQANTNPIILDARGQAPIWLGLSQYKFVVHDSEDVLQPDGGDIIQAEELPDYTFSVISIASLRATSGAGIDNSTVDLLGYYASGDGGGGKFYWDATSIEADNGGTVIQVTGVVNGRWKRTWSGDVNVAWFGAVGDGVTDDALAINSADIVAQSRGADLIWPGKEYLIDSEIMISTPWKGVHGKTKIIISDAYTHLGAYTTFPQAIANIWNRNATDAGYDSSADTVVLEDIIFDNRKTGGSVTTTVSIANVKSGWMRGCRFTSTGVVDTITNFDINSQVRDFTVEKNIFENETTAAAGGNIWVRNNTVDGSLDANAVQGIVIRDNDFFKDSGDESIAVYGGIGVTRDVIIEANRFHASNTGQGTLIGLFAHNSLTARPDAEVYDVKFINNSIVSTSTINNLIKIGDDNSSTSVCDSILVEGNAVKATVDVADSGYLVRVLLGTTRASVNHNVLENVGIVNMRYSIGSTGQCEAHGNKITGGFLFGFVGVVRAIENYLDGIANPPNYLLKNNLSYTHINFSPAHTAVCEAILTNDRTITLTTTNAQINDTLTVVRAVTSTGLFVLNVGIEPLKALGIGEWCKVMFNGTAWVLIEFGTL